MLHLKHLAFEVEPLDLTAKTGTDKFVCLVQHHDVETREQWKCGLCIIKPGASWRGPLAFTLYAGGNILPYALGRVYIGIVTCTSY